MNYVAAIDFLLGRTDYERYPGFQYANRFDLRRMLELLDRLNNPHIHARTVHIAGSKGKGSTAAMVSAGLIEAGFKTGLYTSPHLLTLRERISINGNIIPKRELIRTVQIIKPHVDAVDRENKFGTLSTFELLTAAAFVYFQREGVDYQVLEAGLGGRLDSTNVTSPEVCIITSISLDHTEVLGSTITEIAREKAGIIKPGIPVISSPQGKDAATVIRTTCLDRRSPLTYVGTDITWKEIGFNLKGQTLKVHGKKDMYYLTIPLLGSHQLENAATAVAALELLGLDKEIIEAGLASSKWPGRLQVLKRKPLIVIDGAHTRASMKKLKEALEKYFHFDYLILIIGTSLDKDVSGIVDEVAPLAHYVIATRSRHPRATDPQVLADLFAEHGVCAETTQNVAEAVSKSLDKAGKRNLICATGSLFVVGEMIEVLQHKRSEIYTAN